MKIEVGMYIYYEDCFGFKHDGEVFKIFEDGSFVVTQYPNTNLPQMDDSRRTLKPSDEGKYFWFYPVPEHPIPIEEQTRMRKENKEKK